MVSGNARVRILVKISNHQTEYGWTQKRCKWEKGKYLRKEVVGGEGGTRTEFRLKDRRQAGNPIRQMSPNIGRGNQLP